MNTTNTEVTKERKEELFNKLIETDLKFKEEVLKAYFGEDGLKELLGHISLEEINLKGEY